MRQVRRTLSAGIAVGLLTQVLLAVHPLSSAIADPAPLIDTAPNQVIPEALDGTVTFGGSASTGVAVGGATTTDGTTATLAPEGGGLVDACLATLPECVQGALLVGYAAVGYYRAFRFFFGSHHHGDVDPCTTACGTVEAGYGFNPPGFTADAGNGHPGWNLTGVTWPSGVSGSFVGNSLWFLGDTAVTSVHWGGHTSPTSAPAPGWGTWMSAPAAATGLKGVCMYDPAGQIAAVWGDSYETCGVEAPNQLHELVIDTTCTNGYVGTWTSSMFYENSDGTIPIDIDIPECPSGDDPLEIDIYEKDINPQTGDTEGALKLIYKWNSAWGSGGPSPDVEACLKVAASDHPCIATPMKLIDGIWVPCTNIDCRGYPNPMPGSSDTDTSITGTDGQTYGCGWGTIIPAPLGYCSDAPDPGNGAPTTSNDPRIPAVLAHLESSLSTLTATDKNTALVIAETCLNLSDASGLFAGGDNPCATEPIFAPGSDNPEPTAVDWDGLVVGAGTGDRAPHPGWFRLQRTATSGGAWYTPSRTRDPAIVGAGSPAADCFGFVGDGLDCDEYPFNITVQNGSNNGGLSSLSLVNPTQNRAEGNNLGGFFTRCGIAQDEPAGGASDFLVLPMVFSGAPPTFSDCA